MSPRASGSLFSAITLGDRLLPNRIVMAPMTRGRALPGNVPHPLAGTYYAQRASAGLIITEATQVAPEGVGYPGTPGMHTAAQATAWRAVTTAVHANFGRIYLQLWHVGRVSHPSMQPGGALPVAPSAIAPMGQIFTASGRQSFVVPRALERGEIAGVVSQFEQAARWALATGFDGVDIHAANGYLIDQFLRDGSNQRTDRYGGTVANRARFLLEVVEAVAGVWGAGRVGVRISPLHSYNSMRDNDPVGLARHIAGELTRRDLGYLHLVEPGRGHPMATPSGLQLLHAVRGTFNGRLIVDGGTDRVSAEAAMEGASADLVALATPFIANPDLVNRLRDGLTLASCDPGTFYEGGERGFVDYPTFREQPLNPLAAQG